MVTKEELQARWNLSKAISKKNNDPNHYGVAVKKGQYYYYQSTPTGRYVERGPMRTNMRDAVKDMPYEHVGAYCVWLDPEGLEK